MANVFNDKRYPEKPGAYTTKKTSPAVQAAILAVAKSYFDVRGSKEAPLFTYDQQRTPLENKFNPSFKGIDCSTFVQMVLSGTEYKKSPFVGKDLGVNAKWGLLPYATGVRTAAVMAQHFEKAGCLVDISKGFANVCTGDVVFYNKGKHEDRFKGISHVVLVGEKNPDGTHNTYEVTDYSPYVVHRVLENDYVSGGRLTHGPSMIVMVVRPVYE